MSEFCCSYVGVTFKRSSRVRQETLTQNDLKPNRKDVSLSIHEDVTFLRTFKYE